MSGENSLKSKHQRTHELAKHELPGLSYRRETGTCFGPAQSGHSEHTHSPHLFDQKPQLAALVLRLLQDERPLVSY